MLSSGFLFKPACSQPVDRQCCLIYNTYSAFSLIIHASLFPHPCMQYGATIGIGMCEGGYTGINWRFVWMTLTSWGFTLVISGLLSALFFSSGRFVMMEAVDMFFDGVWGINVN